MHRCSLCHSAPLWVFRERIESRGVLGPAMAQDFISSGACTKSPPVWSRGQVHLSHHSLQKYFKQMQGMLCIYDLINRLNFLTQNESNHKKLCRGLRNERPEKDRRPYKTFPNTQRILPWDDSLHILQLRTAQLFPPMENRTELLFSIVPHNEREKC